MVGKSTHLQVIPQKKTPKTLEICHYKHTKKTSELFFIVQHGHLRNNFANSDSFAKIFVFVHNYNSLLRLLWLIHMP